MTTRNYGKLTNGTFTYAPVELVIDGKITINPTAEQYLSLGFKTVNDACPEEPAPSGSHYDPDGWDEDETTITRRWKIVSDQAIVHKYSKLKLVTAAKALGKWDALKAWITSAGLSDEWAACVYLADDYDGFDRIKAALVTSRIVTDGEIEAILKSAEDETILLEA